MTHGGAVYRHAVVSVLFGMNSVVTRRMVQTCRSRYRETGDERGLGSLALNMFRDGGFSVLLLGLRCSSASPHGMFSRQVTATRAGAWRKRKSIEENLRYQAGAYISQNMYDVTQMPLITCGVLRMPGTSSTCCFLAGRRRRVCRCCCYLASPASYHHYHYLLPALEPAIARHGECGGNRITQDAVVR